MKGPIRLRGHHLGCIAGFAGHGYDRAFTARLAAVADALRTDPARTVRVVDGADDLCAACPHLRADACSRDPGANARARRHDTAFLLALGLAPGDEVAPSSVESRVASDSACRAALRGACACCPWTGVCTFYPRLTP